MTAAWRPVAPDALAQGLAERLAAQPPDGVALRVALDGPDCAAPVAVAESLTAPLRALGHDVAVIPTRMFWRDASLRLEYGREDVTAYRSWLDAGALRREVLEPLGPGGSGRFLPSLRDPETNRSSREPYRSAVTGAVVIVAGEFLLDADLPFDITIHLLLSPAARARRTPADRHWTLAAHDAYEREADPAARADIVIKLEDPRHPAIRVP